MSDTGEGGREEGGERVAILVLRRLWPCASKYKEGELGLFGKRMAVGIRKRFGLVNCRKWRKTTETTSTIDTLQI